MKRIHNKLLLSCFCYFLSFAAMSNQNLEAKQQKAFENSKAVLQKMGLDLLSGEIKIVSAKKILADNQGKNNAYADNINQSLKMHQEQQKNGYVKEPAPRAKELMELKKSSYYQFKKYENEFSLTSTHLRHNISELKMAYTFVGVPESVITHNIGIAPYGAYKQTKYGDGGDGWDGAIQFFENKDIGICEFREHNLKLDVV